MNVDRDDRQPKSLGFVSKANGGPIYPGAAAASYSANNRYGHSRKVTSVIDSLKLSLLQFSLATLTVWANTGSDVILIIPTMTSPVHQL